MKLSDKIGTYPKACPLILKRGWPENHWFTLIFPVRSLHGWISHPWLIQSHEQIHDPIIFHYHYPSKTHLQLEISSILKWRYRYVNTICTIFWAIEIVGIFIYWLVVYLPLWKISIRMIVFNIWENQIHVPNHQPVYLWIHFNGHWGRPHLQFGQGCNRCNLKESERPKNMDGNHWKSWEMDTFLDHQITPMARKTAGFQWFGTWITRFEVQ